jgi:hypothetical protein
MPEDARHNFFEIDKKNCLIVFFTKGKISICKYIQYYEIISESRQHGNLVYSSVLQIKQSTLPATG